MSVGKWLEYNIYEDPQKPARRQEVFDLKAIEQALGSADTLTCHSIRFNPARPPACTTISTIRSRLDARRGKS